MRALEFRIISESEADRFDRTPHNPPVYCGTFTKGDFSREWWAVRAALKHRLELFGDEWQLSTSVGDFMLSESRGDSRWMYITFVTTRLWRPEFVPAVADLLATLPHDYCVACLTELNDEEMLVHPLVYLVISSTTVFGNARQGHLLGPGSVRWTECNDELQRFGFPFLASPK